MPTSTPHKTESSIALLKRPDRRFEKGAIPDYVFSNMTSLLYLDLGYNQIVGPLKSFGNLCSLKTLFLSNNSLTGQLPQLFSYLSVCSKHTLETLSLENNILSGSLPDFTLFSSLRELQIKGNKLNGSFPKSFGQLSHLTILNLDNNNLGGSIPDLSVFVSLKELHIHGNLFNGTFPKSIGKLSKLELLDVSSNFLEGNGSSNSMDRKGFLSKTNGANLMKSKDGEASEIRMGKNNHGKLDKSVKTNNSGVGKGSRFDVLNDEAEMLLAEGISVVKSKGGEGIVNKNNNTLKEITNLSKKPPINNSKSVRKVEKFPKSRPIAYKECQDGASCSKGNIGGRGKNLHHNANIQASVNISETLQ
ncbi:hypothetical protein EZV62_027347 [Acer yangbiense]|uniref:Uncharacterized protein n=1 Tax=Acer yangbiense TaxID=1000413 RepID=A0A5C7GTU5_9ROSI|nr:hypothetical protein EZV62_027347 [Acer yangbiense]